MAKFFSPRLMKWLDLDEELHIEREIEHLLGLIKYRHGTDHVSYQAGLDQLAACRRRIDYIQTEMASLRLNERLWAVVCG